MTWQLNSTGSLKQNPEDFLKWRTESRAMYHVLYSVHVCPFKRCPRWPPTDGGGVWCGRLLTMMPGQGGSPLVPMSLGGLRTPGSRGPASSTSVLIIVQHARHTVSATQGHCSVEPGFPRKSQPAWRKASRYTGSMIMNSNWLRISS